jgi:hypothetical protein
MHLDSTVSCVIMDWSGMTTGNKVREEKKEVSF